MAATAVAISAADLAARAADAPLVIGSNALQTAYTAAVANLVTNTAGDLATGDASAAGFDRRYLQDRYKHKKWKQTAAGTTCYIVIDTGVADGSGEVGALVVYGHNWSGQTVEVKMDSTAPPVGDAWTGATTIADFGHVAGSALVVKLQAADRHKARYLRIKISGASLQREAAEIFLGRDVQFPDKPLYGSSSPYARFGSFTEVRGSGGITTRVVNHGSLTSRFLNFVFKQADTGVFFTELLDWFESVSALYGGARDFWYVDLPTTAPAGNRTILAHLVDAKLSPSPLSPTVTRFSMEFTEQGN